MLVDILKLLKSSDIEMMKNAATITFNVSVLVDKTIAVAANQHFFFFSQNPYVVRRRP